MSKQTKSAKSPGSAATRLRPRVGLSHYDAAGQASMVDISGKQPTHRTAIASAFVELSPAVLMALPVNPKGNPLEVARFAGIQAAKRTSELIPMCHPLPLTHVDVRADVVEGGVHILATAATTGPTGVEMEALTAASVAALTVYDMTKALDKSIVIRAIQLESKTGGKSGDYSRTTADASRSQRTQVNATNRKRRSSAKISDT